MSYKNAMARLPMGGGKSMIFGPPPASPEERAQVLRAHGRLVDRLGGAFITAEDVGTSLADMEHIAETTAYVAGRAGGSGDPSPHTARGVIRAMQAAARFRWGSDRLTGKTVALQGCGNVGLELARQLTREGALIIANDLDRSRVARVVAECGATEAIDRIHAAAADVFAPCALGGVLDDATIPELRAELVVGGANNQLHEPRHGRTLMERGITYVPDYVANAGGVSYGGAMEIAKVPREEALARVELIYDTSLMVLEQARAEGIPPSDAADRIAEERIRTRRLD
jgi:leucine dehydrogenase